MGKQYNLKYKITGLNYFIFKHVILNSHLPLIFYIFKASWPEWLDDKWLLGSRQEIKATLLPKFFLCSNQARQILALGRWQTCQSFILPGSQFLTWTLVPSCSSPWFSPLPTITISPLYCFFVPTGIHTYCYLFYLKKNSKSQFHFPQQLLLHFFASLFSIKELFFMALFNSLLSYSFKFQSGPYPHHPENFTPTDIHILHSCGFSAASATVDHCLLLENTILLGFQDTTHLVFPTLLAVVFYSPLMIFLLPDLVELECSRAWFFSSLMCSLPWWS